ncbi:MAG: PQQ-dependent dehydrogenase, methanol/ethanol family [Hyphomicrobium sp.]|uniref:PQQ-dependent dehydrogenase, methanol/ethanol family n=1 Tax=Hyphomicrobium sp. TaxID=82 RepID=UPI00132809A1|nr:PQQ-dependent dehydrogenase, methanol/ethanol family [Hyphomicrobium sp.]KAB2942569.1 MAG: PQQ-dependent dehydrogenase, methanol/ethanol family [Hyphomicrobium sp.]MBZ0208545.1 PQQ-dependent dehydrogenase, methanol/ethanol family [Hyphomicrobium sp.]
MHITRKGAIRFAGGLTAALIGLAGPGMANEEIEKRAQDPNTWPAPGRDNKLTRHSPLKDITTDNVGKLQMIWSQSTGALRGHEGQPLFIEDVGGKPMMFFISGCPNMAQCNIAQGLDLSDPDNPKQIWNYVKKDDRDESAVPRACCDTVNRGASYADGKLVYGTLDGYVIALDAQTGKEAWVVKHAWPEKGETITSAPLIAENLVIIGFGGDEFAARGRVTAYSLADGKMVWNCHSTGADADVCLTPETNKANPHYGTAGQDLGIKTFPGEDWKIGGGAAWGWYSYDPELKLVYYSTGNPGLWSPAYRCPDKSHEECNTGAFDNKWSMTIFARKVDTGEAVWAYQMTPFDQWDYDGVNENILVDMKVDGKDRKALVHFDRNGFAYVLDRADGTLLRANKYVTTDWAEKVDLKTGRPIKVREHSPLERGRNVSACPSAMGGKDQQPCAVDPKEPNKFYCPTNNWCMELEPQERTHTQQGTVYVFANVYMFPEKPGTTGKIKKFDVLTGKADWEIPDPYPNWGGTMVTDGGLMFYGSLGGDFRAVDRKSGKVLWHRKLASGMIGNPITYKVKDKQYVSILVGIGGWIGVPVTAGLDLNDKFGAIGATAMTKAANLDKIPQAGTLFTFRVME